MSWSLPREIFRPQRTSRSSDGSVRRPDFWTASFRRVSSMAADLGSAGFFAIAFAVTFDSLGCELVAAVTRHDEARDAPDGRDTDTGEPMDLSVGQALLQELHHRPAIGHGLDLGGRAQVLEERLAFLGRAQRRDRGEQLLFRLDFLAGRDVAVELHGRSNVLTR